MFDLDFTHEPPQNPTLSALMESNGHTSIDIANLPFETLYEFLNLFAPFRPTRMVHIRLFIFLEHIAAITLIRWPLYCP